MNTREVLNEAFFKKTTYKDRLNKKLPAYAPVGQDKIKGVGGSFDLNPFNVTDSNELKKRLTSAFGVAFGNNSVRAMAQKSIKTFPIIVSDNIEPETVVMFKRYLEEQYAEYINLLIQNQVIDISQFTTGTDDGNVAIQAVDSLSNPDLSSNRIATAAKSGELSLNDLTANIPLARLISNEQVKFKPGGKLLNTLFEDAIVVPNEYADQVAKVMNEGILLEDDAEDLKQAREELEKYKKELDSLKKQLESLKNTNADNTELKKLIKSLEDAIGYSDDFDRLINGGTGNGLVGRVSSTKAMLIKFRKEIEDANKTIETLKGNYNTSREDWQKEIKKLNDEHAKSKEDWKVETAAKDAEIASEKEKNKSLEAEIEKIKKELEDSNLARDKYDKARQDLEKQKDDYYQGLTKLNQFNPNRTTPSMQTPQLVVNDRAFQMAMDTTVASMLSKSENAKIKDKFEKATFLLQSNIIAGKEYCDYCTYRLGIPLSREARQKLAVSYKMADIKTSKVKGGETWHGLIGRKELSNIAKNKRIANPILKDACKLKIKDYVKSIIAGTGAAGTAAVAAAILQGPIGIVTASAFAGGSALSLLIRKLKNKKIASANSQIKGWERVEALIEDLDRQIEDAKSVPERYLTNFNDKHNKSKVQSRIQMAVNDKSQYHDYNTSARNFNNMGKPMGGITDEASDAEKEKADIVAHIISELDSIKAQLKPNINEETCVCINNNANFDSVLDEDIVIFEAAYKTLYDNDPDFRASIVSEAAYVPNVTSPITVKNITYDPKNMMVTPAYSARSNYGYGEIEMDRRDLKDRKYNAPLVMTVHFKERLSDGKYSDNELTAVIGIQGVVYRVPSDEMKYILKQNAEGITLKGALKGGNIGDAIADLLTGAKIKKDVEKLPVSSDVWHNLEKIGHLAVANKLGGKASHNIANAHIIFSQKEIDDLRNEDGIDYLKDKSLAEQLVKRYNAFSVMVANDPGERVFVYDDPDSISWNVIPYSALRNRDSSDQLTSALIRASSGRI